MLAMSTMREIPEELANRMMMAHGSSQLLRALHGEPLVTLPEELSRPVKVPSGYTPVSLRPAVVTPEAVRDIIARVGEEFNVTADELIGRRRAMLFVLARSTAIQLVRDRKWESGEHRHSITQIGCFFGNRDHSTICYALDRFPDYARRFPKVAAAYAKLSGELGL